MVAKVKFLLLGSSSSIAEASLSVMILTLAIPKQNVCTHEMMKGYLSWLKMHYGGL